MKIGVMLRGIGKQGGTGVYARNLVPELLRLGGDVDWVLIYSGSEQTGWTRLPDNAREVVLPCANPIVWDQVLVPWFARRSGLDLIFHTKFTVPLVSPAPTVMALHGASWYVQPSLYPREDVIYVKAAMPLYCRAATRMISNSQCTTRDYIDIVGADPDKISTVPLAPAASFTRITDKAELDRVRGAYRLPETFVLSVAAYDPRKNVPRLVQAFLQARRPSSCKLVVVGKGCTRFRSELAHLGPGLDASVIFSDWVEQGDLPALLSCATALFFPSVYEEFGIPNCEAMACGTPIITAATGAPPEVVGNAGILVDPMDVDAMAWAVERILADARLRAELSELGLERAKMFSWKRTAEETLAILRETACANSAAYKPRRRRGEAQQARSNSRPI